MVEMVLRILSVSSSRWSGLSGFRMTFNLVRMVFELVRMIMITVVRMGFWSVIIVVRMVRFLDVSIWPTTWYLAIIHLISWLYFVLWIYFPNIGSFNANFDLFLSVNLALNKNMRLKYKCLKKISHASKIQIFRSCERPPYMAISGRLTGLDKIKSPDLSSVAMLYVGFWCRKRQIWSTHRVDWDGNLKQCHTQTV